MSDFDVIMSISSEMIVVVDEAYIMRHATLNGQRSTLNGHMHNAVLSCNT